MARDTIKTIPRYQDLIIRVAATIVAAYIITIHGEFNSLFSMLKDPSFYIEYGTTLLITALDVQFIYLATVRLDQQFDWHQHSLNRALLQLFFGVFLPTLATFLLAALYFALYGQNILERNYHVYRLPIIVAFIVMANGYYYIRYLLAERARLKEQSMFLSQVASLFRQQSHGGAHVIKVTGEMLTLFRDVECGTVMEETKERAMFIARTHTRSFPVPLEEIAYFYLANKVVYLRLFSGQDHLLAISLDTIEGQLESLRFFRVSRQMIVNYAAVREFYDGGHGKLGFTLNPPFAEETTVSKLLAKSFKSWIVSQRI